MNKNFYVTSYSTGMMHPCLNCVHRSQGCVTTCLFREQSDSEYCNNSIQHARAEALNMQHAMQGWLYINIDNAKTSIVFERDELSNWFASETTVAMQYFSTSDATQQAMPQGSHAGNQKIKYAI